MISADMICKARDKIPILYYDDLSPQARSVLMLIKLLDMNVQTVRVDLFKGQHLNPQFESINPLRTVPTLVHDGLVLTDSHVILMYLCESSCSEFGRVLYPRCAVKRMRLLNLLFFEIAILYRRHSEYMTDLLRNTFQGSDVNFHKKKILDAYRIMEALLTNNDFLMGQSLTIADISCITTVGALDVMVPVDCNAYPRLHTWFICMRSMSEYCINECGISRQRELMETVGQFSCGVATESPAAANLGPHVTISGVFIDNDCEPSQFVADARKYPCGCTNTKNCGRMTCESVRDGGYCSSPCVGATANTYTCSGRQALANARANDNGCCSCDKTLTNSNMKRKHTGKRSGGSSKKCNPPLIKSGQCQNTVRRDRCNADDRTSVCDGSSCMRRSVGSNHSLRESLVENTQHNSNIGVASPKSSILSAARQSLQQQNGSVRSSISNKPKRSSVSSDKQSPVPSNQSMAENSDTFSPTTSMALALGRERPSSRKSSHASVALGNTSRPQSTVQSLRTTMQTAALKASAEDQPRISAHTLEEKPSGSQ